MAVFAIGDTHLSLGTDKPMDIFGGWQDYVSRLEKNWIKIVNPEDTVVIPGDVSWALNLEDTKADFEFLNSLPGKKLLGKGNHDFWWGTVTKMNAFLKENGFDSIEFLFNNAYEADGMALCGTRGWFFDDDCEQSEKVLMRECGRLKISIDAAKATGLTPVVFLHYPPISGGRICEPIMNILIEEQIDRCYYAHLHGQSIAYAFNGDYEGIKFSLVSADSLNFVPHLITL